MSGLEERKKTDHLSDRAMSAWRREVTNSLRGEIKDLSVEELSEKLGVFESTAYHLKEMEVWTWPLIFHVANTFGYKFLMVQK